MNFLKQLRRTKLNSFYKVDIVKDIETNLCLITSHMAVEYNSVEKKEFDRMYDII